MSRAGYARLSNEFWSSPSVMKMLAVNPAAVGFYVASVSYASDNLTDGLIEEQVARYVLRAPEDVIEYLVAEGKWEPVENGWMIHNYTKWQNSRKQVETARERDRNRKTRDASSNVPDGFHSESERNANGFQTDSRRNPNGIQTAFNVNQNQKENQDTYTQVVEDVNVVDARAREAAATPTGDDARREEALLEAWLPTSDDLAHAASLGVDGKTLADKMRDKLTRKGFDACGIHRRTPQALDAMFRTWIEHEAQWAKEKPKQVKPPDTVHTTRPQHSWCGPEVRAIMNPYRDRFPEPNPGDVGPGQAWFKACKDVAQRLDDGENETSIIEWADATYGTIPATTATNTS